MQEVEKVYYRNRRRCETVAAIQAETGNPDGQRVISYLLRETYEKEKQLAVLIREELEQNYIQKERIKWATQTAEQNSIVLLDAMNTLLWMLNAKENISVEHAAHPVVKQSKDAIKEKIAYFKQKSDDRKAKADGKSNEKS